MQISHSGLYTFAVSLVNERNAPFYTENLFLIRKVCPNVLALQAETNSILSFRVLLLLDNDLKFPNSRKFTFTKTSSKLPGTTLCKWGYYLKFLKTHNL